MASGSAVWSCFGTMNKLYNGFKKTMVNATLLRTLTFLVVTNSTFGLEPSPKSDGMAVRLEELANKTDPRKNQFFNSGRAELLRKRVEQAKGRVELINAKSMLAQELLKAGQTEEAIVIFNELSQVFEQNAASLDPRNLANMRIQHAVAYLRQAEEDNCLTNHTTQSCLFPIQAGGIHKIQRGSRAAVNVLTRHLQGSPDDLRARWLLNVAYMTLGEYPEKVPQQWQLEPKLFQSEYPIKRFNDVSGNLGLDLDDLAGGSIIEDFDGDGYLDIMNSSMANRGPLRLFRNNADGTFTEQTAKAGLTGQIGSLNLIQGDYNNDGHVDVFALRGGWMYEAGELPNSLLRNNGNGTFTDVTEEAGLLSFRPTQTGVWLDFNGDGWLDLFIGNEATETSPYPCELYRNNRNGTFTECAASVGITENGFVKAVASGDFNNDGRPDLYISRRGQPNLLYRNDGPTGANTSAAGWKFTDVSASAGVTEPIMSFPAWFWDYDNDGWHDIFVSGYDLKSLGDIAADYLGIAHDSEKPRLFRNKRDGTFEDVTKSAGLNRLLHSMGSNFGDLDNDGYLDFYVGTGDPNLGTLIPNRMFRNADGKIFQDVTSDGGFGHLQKGHAIAFGDLDHDGDQDIYADMGGAYEGDHYRNALFENPAHGNHWISLKLEGTKSNRSAIGARIRVILDTEAGERSVYKTVCSGGSFGASPLRQEIGLGKARTIRSIEIFWPVTGVTQTITGIEMDGFYKIQEGSDKAIAWNLKRFKFASGSPGHAHDHSHHKHH